MVPIGFVFVYKKLQSRRQGRDRPSSLTCHSSSFYFLFFIFIFSFFSWHRAKEFLVQYFALFARCATSMLIIICCIGSNSNSLHVPDYWTQLRPWAATPVYSSVFRWYRNNNNMNEMFLSFKYSSSLMACKALVRLMDSKSNNNRQTELFAHHFHMLPFPHESSCRARWLTYYDATV